MAFPAISSSDIRIAFLEQEIRNIKSDISSNESEMRTFALTIKYVTQYHKYKVNFDRYKQSKNPERYLQDHISVITFFQEPADILKRSDIDPEKLNLEAFRAEYFRMKKENETLADKNIGFAYSTPLPLNLEGWGFLLPQVAS